MSEIPKKPVKKYCSKSTRAIIFLAVLLIILSIGSGLGFYLTKLNSDNKTQTQKDDISKVKIVKKRGENGKKQDSIKEKLKTVMNQNKELLDQLNVKFFDKKLANSTRVTKMTLMYKLNKNLTKPDSKNETFDITTTPTYGITSTEYHGDGRTLITETT